jgi:hypothetical protein
LGGEDGEERENAEVGAPEAGERGKGSGRDGAAGRRGAAGGHGDRREREGERDGDRVGRRGLSDGDGGGEPAGERPARAGLAPHEDPDEQGDRGVRGDAEHPPPHDRRLEELERARDDQRLPRPVRPAEVGVRPLAVGHAQRRLEQQPLVERLEVAAHREAGDDGGREPERDRDAAGHVRAPAGARDRR